VLYLVFDRRQWRDTGIRTERAVFTIDTAAEAGICSPVWTGESGIKRDFIDPLTRKFVLEIVLEGIK
jgi:hypothetical protein